MARLAGKRQVGDVMIECKRFDAFTDEFFQHGPGAFFWSADLHHSDEESLYLLVPDDRSINWIRVKHDSGNGGQDDRGWFHSWNGDKNKPTVRASILTATFHGWLTDGELVETL